MKRLVSLDWLRGWAILWVVFFHALVFHNDAPPQAAATQAPGLAAFLEYVVAWAGMFALVSGVANTLSFDARLRRGVPPAKVLAHAVGGGLAVVALNYVYLALFSPGFLRPVASIGLLPAFVLTGGYVPSTPDRLLFCTALLMIGWGRVATGVVVRVRGTPAPGRAWRGYALLTALATAMVLGYPLVKALLRPLLVQPTTAASLVPNLVITWLVGPMDPVFPYTGFTLYGVVLGLLVADGARRRAVLGYGYAVGGAWSVAALVLHLRQGYWNNPYDIPDLSPLIQILGPVLLCTTLALHLLDFADGRERWRRGTRLVRTFGLVSLSAFLLEGTVSALLRRLVSLAKPGFTSDPGFLFLVFGPLVLVFWIVAIKLWARVRFAGSFEWLLVRASARLTGAASGRLDAPRLLGTPVAPGEGAPAAGP